MIYLYSNVCSRDFSYNICVAVCFKMQVAVDWGLQLRCYVEEFHPCWVLNSESHIFTGRINAEFHFGVSMDPDGSSVDLTPFSWVSWLVTLSSVRTVRAGSQLTCLNWSTYVCHLGSSQLGISQSRGAVTDKCFFPFFWCTGLGSATWLQVSTPHQHHLTLWAEHSNWSNSGCFQQAGSLDSL